MVKSARPGGSVPEPGTDAELSYYGIYQYSMTSIPASGGLCSDRGCPCPETPIPRGTGYLYISAEAVDFMKRQNSGELKDLPFMIIMGPMPVLVCEQGARLRHLDLKVANADAKRWWATGQVPLRPTPTAP